MRSNNDNDILSVMLGWIVGLASAVMGGAIVAFIAWNNMPVVGGEYWFYIHVGGTVIAFIIAAYIFMFIGQLLLLLFVFLAAFILD